MIDALPEGIVILTLGPSGAALGRRLREALAGAEWHGPRAHPDDWDQGYDRVVPHIARLFKAGPPIVGLCASGILIRAVAAAARRQDEPSRRWSPWPRTARRSVPLLGGHHGANALARPIARSSWACRPAITTAGDNRFGLALDAPPAGLDPGQSRRCQRRSWRLLEGGRSACPWSPAACAWLRRAALPLDAKRRRGARS